MINKKDYITILIISILIIYVAYLFITKKWAKLKEIALSLMLNAERIYAENEGEEKFNSVFNRIYIEYIPFWLEFFIPPTKIRLLLQSWYDQAKKMLQEK